MMNQKVLRLQVTNFRNIQSIPLEFSKKINCIFGNNGNGKTNLLEAIYYLGHKKSFKKNAKFPQFLSMDCEKGEILFSSIFETDREYFYSGKIYEDKSEWYLDNSSYKKSINLKPIFINPFDSYQFHNTASFRRKLVDQLIGILDPNYKKQLSKYQNTLKQRNFLLMAKPSMYREQLEALDEQFISYSVYLIGERLKFLKEIKQFCSKTFQEIFSENHELELKLDTKFIYNPDEIKQKIITQRDKDIMIGQTSYGVHRDDYIFFFNGLNSYDYCSLGQQKMSFLSLLFAYIELFRYKSMSYPIVLIDDVSGELDSLRWRNLISYLDKKDFQVFITTANENFKDELLKLHEAKKFLLSEGDIETF
jgi:DNA replication and repair protein RecF